MCLTCLTCLYSYRHSCVNTCCLREQQQNHSLVITLLYVLHTHTAGCMEHVVSQSQAPFSMTFCRFQRCAASRSFRFGAAAASSGKM